MKNILLKSLVKKLREAKEEQKEIITDDSVDIKIDDFFSEYEADALKNVETVEENRRFSFYLKEEQKKEKKKEDEEVEKEKSSELNVSSFASDISRLIKNHSSLIDYKNIILKRSISFLKKNYSDEIVDSFVQTLESEYSLAVGKTQKDFEDKWQAPHSDRAGSGGGGGGGI